MQRAGGGTLAYGGLCQEHSAWQRRASTTKCKDPWRPYHALLLLGYWSGATKHQNLNGWCLGPGEHLSLRFFGSLLLKKSVDATFLITLNGVYHSISV